MRSRKPSIHWVPPTEPDSWEPTWWVRWYRVDDGTWQKCSHWTWRSAYECVKTGWAYYGGSWK